MFNIQSTIIMFLLYLFEGYCVQFFFQAFVIPKRRGRWSKYMVGIVWVLINLCGWILSEINTGMDSIVKLVGSTMALFIFTLCWYQGNVLLKLFPVVQFIAIKELALFAVYSFSGISSSIIDVILNKSDLLQKSPDAMLHLTKGIVLLSVLLVEIMQGGLIFYSCKKIVKSYRYREKDRLDKEIFFYLLPSVAGILIAVLVRLLVFVVEDGQTVFLYGQHPALYFIVPMIAIVLLGVILFSFRIYQDMIGLQREKSEKIIMENQITQMQNSMMEMEQFYRGLREVRHDIENQMMVMEQLLGQDDIKNKEVTQFFEDMQRSLSQLEIKIHTGNPVSDAVISSKFRYAATEIESIRLSADEFLLTEKVRVRPYDIGIILNNGLDNAIEACKRLRKEKPEAEVFISVRSFWKNKLFFMEIENSFDGMVQFDERSGLPISTKEDEELHGIGLKNIRSCAEKYSGGMDCFVENGRFILSVMLKTER